MTKKLKSGEALYQDPTGQVISREQLHPYTRKNLLALEEHGFAFDPVAVRVRRPYMRKNWREADGEYKPTGQMGSSFIIRGVDPAGNPVLFVRKETKVPGAGRTYIEAPGANLDLSTALRVLGGYDIEYDPYRGGYTTKRGIAYFKELPKKSKKAKKSKKTRR